MPRRWPPERIARLRRGLFPMPHPEPLQSAAQREIDDEGEPERVVAELRKEREMDGEEGHRGDGARGQHAACGQHSDENAVVEEGGDAGQRNQQNPRQIGLRSLDNEGFRG